MTTNSLENLINIIFSVGFSWNTTSQIKNRVKQYFTLFPYLFKQEFSTQQNQLKTADTVSLCYEWHILQKEKNTSF